MAPNLVLVPRTCERYLHGEKDLAVVTKQRISNGGIILGGQVGLMASQEPQKREGGTSE